MLSHDLNIKSVSTYSNELISKLSETNADCCCCRCREEIVNVLRVKKIHRLQFGDKSQEA